MKSRLAAPVKRDLERRNGIARDLERMKDGSPSGRVVVARREAEVEKKEKEEEEEEEEEVLVVVVVVGQHEHGRTVAQSGHKVARRSRTQVGQTPVRRCLEGCFGHFHTSTSSIYEAILL